MTPEDLVPLLLIEFIPAAKRNLDATTIKHLAEAARVALDMGQNDLCSLLMARVRSILAEPAPVPPIRVKGSMTPPELEKALDGAASFVDTLNPPKTP